MNMEQLIRQMVKDCLPEIEEFPFLSMSSKCPTGEAFVTFINGMKGEGADLSYESKFNKRGDAINAFLRSVEEYAGYKVSNRLGDKPDKLTLYWRVLPQVEEQETGFVVRARLVISDLPEACYQGISRNINEPETPMPPLPEKRDYRPHLVIAVNEVLWGIGIDEGLLVFLSQANNAWTPMTHIPSKVLEYATLFMEQHYPLLNSNGYPKMKGNVTAKQPEKTQVFSDGTNVTVIPAGFVIGTRKVE